MVVRQECERFPVFARVLGSSDQLAQDGQVVLARLTSSDVRDSALDGLPCLEHVQHVVQAEAGDHGAAARQHGREAVSGHPRQGLPHGHPPESDLQRQLLLVHDGSRRDP